jgi:hypothetical protein
VAGIISGLLTGSIVAFTLLQILSGVFDPPADLPAIPLGQIGAVIAGVVVALGCAVAIADRGIARLGLVSALRER